MYLSFLQNQKIKLALILVAALLLRLAGIASRPIWYDEAFSVLLARQGPAAILSGTLAKDSDTSAAEEHPPAYYFMLWGWMQIFGSSLISVRMLSVLASLGIILCIHQIAIHLFDPSTAITAAFISAILPFQVHYGQEIRMYVFLAFWLCLATYALLKRRWFLFSLSAALAQYTHNLAAFYLIPLALTPVFQKDWKTLRSLTLSGFAALLLYSPWLTQLPAQLSKVTTNFWIEKPGIEKIFILFLLYLPHLPLANNQLLPGLLLATLTVALAAFQTYRAQKEDIQNAKWGRWLAYLAFTPPIILWLVSQISPIYVERALLPSHAIFCIWLGWAFTRTKLPRPIQLVVFTLLLSAAGLGLYQHITYQGFPYGSFASLDQSIQNRFQPGDVIIHSSKLSYLPAFYFNGQLPQSYLIDPPGSSSDTLSPATEKILHLASAENMAAAAANAERVWFIIYQQSLDEYKSQGVRLQPDIEYLDAAFRLTSTEKWGDLRVFLYTKRGP
jgi:uncharacterized membrane protein